MTEMKSKEEILAQREKELSQKAQEEVAKATPSKYQAMTDRLYGQNMDLLEGALDQLSILYVDNLKQNGKKAAGFGTKACKVLSDYVKNECFGFQDPSKELGKEVLEDLIKSYHGVNAESLDKELEDEDKMTNAICENIKQTVTKTLKQKLDTTCLGKVEEAAQNDVEGFRTYVAELAKAQKVEFEPNEAQSIEGLMKIYFESVKELAKEKMQKKKK